MGVRIRRLARRTIVGIGALTTSIATLALVSNLFCAGFVRHASASASRQLCFDSGAVTYMRGEPHAFRKLVTPPDFSLKALVNGTSGWHREIVWRSPTADWMFGPYEWAPVYADSGTACVIVVPWWTVIAAGVMLMAAGRFGVPMPRGVCGRCTYDLRGLSKDTAVCPECGTKFAAGANGQVG